MGLPTLNLPMAWLLPILLAGCAATPALPNRAALEPGGAGTPTTTGVLVAVRPLQQGDWRRSVLSALGTPGPAAAGDAAEFVIRMDDGRAISVVQPDPGGLRAGLRVSLLPGRAPLAATRIAAALAAR